MGPPGHMTNERRKQLGRGIPKTLRQKHNDQWIDIEQIIYDPQIFEFAGVVAREEIDGATTHIDRKDPPDALKIVSKLNDETAV